VTEDHRERGLLHLLQPDVLLPAQYDARRRRPVQGEQRLVLAILEDAINCYRKHAFALDRHGQRLFRETEEWVMSDERVPFSFVYICEVLDIDIEYLRTGLRRWRAHDGATSQGRRNGTDN